MPDSGLSLVGIRGLLLSGGGTVVLLKEVVPDSRLTPP